MAATEQRATLGLLEAAFSARSCRVVIKEDKSRFELVVRQSPASKDVNTEAEKAAALEAVMRRQPLKI
jgi:transcriptional regulator of aromatic amino acid metabolism